jgi:glycerophosphoryl diester phosphodiesterase
MNKITFIILLALCSIMMNAQTKIIAHRGFSGIAPENTLIAFQKAIECGADYFELDIHKTKDDSIVVIHDASVDRTSSNNMKGNVAEMTYSELTAVRAGYSQEFGDKYKNEKIPTLREALELARGKIKVCIEIKVYDAEREVLKIVNDPGVNDGVIIFSFYYPVLEKIRQMDTNIPILLLVNTFEDTIIDSARAIRANAIGVGGGTIVTKQLPDTVHDHGMELWKWTVNDENEMQKLIDMRIDGLITNYPDKALKYRVK